MIDTHAHLDALSDPDGALTRAREAGVSRVITIGLIRSPARAMIATTLTHDRRVSLERTAATPTITRYANSEEMNQ